MNAKLKDAPGKANTGLIMLLTLVATLGGLLFGYDTAVINGAVSALEAYFITPLLINPEMATSVIIEYKVAVTICIIVILILINSFLFKLFGARKGSITSVIVSVIVLFLLYTTLLGHASEMTENMASSIKGFTNASALIGCIIGGSIGGYISQNIGRKSGLIIAAVLFLISAVGSAMPETLNFFGGEVISSFIFYRVVGGIGVGLASMLSPMYIAEIAPAGIRGKLVSWNQFAIIFGMLVVYFVNYFIAKGQSDIWVYEIGWRRMFASEIIPASIFFILLFFVPETPRFLVLANKENNARKLLIRLNGKERAEKVLEDIKKSLSAKRLPWLHYGSLVIVIGIMLSVFQQFVGINVVLYYASDIFKNMGAKTDVALMQTIIVGAINLLFTVVAILTVDKFGRKPLMIIGALGMAVSMFWLGLAFFAKQGMPGFGAIIAMLAYTASFALSWGPVTWVLLSEIFPNAIRGAMSIAVAAQWIANLIISWTFPMLDKNVTLTSLFHHGFSYWIYGFMGILAAWFMWKVVPETKGRSLEEMEQLWLKRKN